MSNDNNSDFDHESDGSEYDSETGSLTGAVTEKNPNQGDHEDECKCEEGCETQSCTCFKHGTGCSASCGCTASCQNIFNGLNYFFGDEKCSANPCFSKWLTGKKEAAGMDLKDIKRNSLLQRIMRCPGYDN